MEYRPHAILAPFVPIIEMTMRALDNDAMYMPRASGIMETDHVVYFRSIKNSGFQFVNVFATQTWILLGITALLLITICYASDVVKSVAYHDRITTNFFRHSSSNSRHLGTKLVLPNKFYSSFGSRWYLSFSNTLTGTCVDHVDPHSLTKLILGKICTTERDQNHGRRFRRIQQLETIFPPDINTTTNSPEGSRFSRCVKVSPIANLLRISHVTSELVTWRNGFMEAQGIRSHVWDSQ